MGICPWTCRAQMAIPPLGNMSTSRPVRIPPRLVLMLIVPRLGKTLNDDSPRDVRCALRRAVPERAPPCARGPARRLHSVPAGPRLWRERYEPKSAASRHAGVPQRGFIVLANATLSGAMRQFAANRRIVPGCGAAMRNVTLADATLCLAMRRYSPGRRIAPIAFTATWRARYRRDRDDTWAGRWRGVCNSAVTTPREENRRNAAIIQGRIAAVSCSRALRSRATLRQLLRLRSCGMPTERVFGGTVSASYPVPIRCDQYRPGARRA